jgi:hypothetical protein
MTTNTLKVFVQRSSHSGYTEVESGRRNDRPKLAEALAACRLHRATLLIAKLDRLARNVAFVSNLMEAGVDFVASIAAGLNEQGITAPRADVSKHYFAAVHRRARRPNVLDCGLYLRLTHHATTRFHYAARRCGGVAAHGPYGGL